MLEVTITLRFNHHCLGNCRRDKVSTFLHDPNGHVMFLPTWWSAIVRYAADVLNHYQAVVRHIDWDPVVVGTPRTYRRFYAPGRFMTHEAFFPGDRITVHAVLPSEIPLDGFRDLLDIAGRYKGMSPYKPEKKYGTFEVMSVIPRKRRIHAAGQLKSETK